MPHPHSRSLSLSLSLIRRVACERLLQKFLFKFHFGLARWSQIQLQLQQRVCNKNAQEFLYFLPSFYATKTWLATWAASLHWTISFRCLHGSLWLAWPVCHLFGNRIRVSGLYCMYVCVTHKASPENVCQMLTNQLFRQLLCRLIKPIWFRYKLVQTHRHTHAVESINKQAAHQL